MDLQMFRATSRRRTEMSMRARPVRGRLDARVELDLAEPGYDEETWRYVLRDAPRWSPPAGPLVVAAAHPNDETLAAGGLIAQWCEQGHPVTVVVASDGEATYPGVADLGAIRRAELDAALHALGGGTIHVVRLGLPGGRLAERGERIAKALTLACMQGPATLVAPLRGDGHPDHDTVAGAAELAAACARATLARYAIRGWHRGIAHMAVRQPAKLVIDGRARAAKRDALLCFESQRTTRLGAPALPAHVLRHFERDYEVFFT